MVTRPLCHIQYLVLYLSHLQNILLAAQWELYFKVVLVAHLPWGFCLWYMPLGFERPLLLVKNWAASTHVTSSLGSNLEAFSHNPLHGSFLPLAFRSSVMTNYANQWFLLCRLNCYFNVINSKVKLTYLMAI